MNKQIIFEINKELDFRNHLIIMKVTADAKGTPPGVKEYFDSLRNASEEDRRGIFEEYSSKFYSDEMKPARELMVKEAQEAWDKVSDEYILRMEKIHGQKFPYETVTAVLTTTPFGYGFDYGGSKPWFACPKDSTIRSTHVAMHELMHAFFIKYYEQKTMNEYGLNKDFTWLLQESFTVLLNLELSDMRKTLDKGHPGHEEVREMIAEEWNKNKDFETVLKNVSVELIKFMKD